MSIPCTPRIIVIDNDPEVGEDLKAIFEQRGYSVVVAPGEGTILLEQARE